MDGCSNLYISDQGNSRIRRVDPAGIITTIAGTGGAGYSGDGGPATAATISTPNGIKVDSFLNIYFADSYDNIVLKIGTANRPPAFTGGHSHTLNICEDTLSVDISMMLTVSDADALQTETWSLVKGPVHGSVTAGYSATSMGVAITPSGLSYAHATGYMGADTFMIRVSDCGNASDTVIFYMQIVNCALHTADITLRSSLLAIPNPNDGKFTIKLSTPQNEAAHMVITNVIGEKVMEQEALTNEPTTVKLAAPPGIYFLNMSAAGSRYFTKIIINPQ